MNLKEALERIEAIERHIGIAKEEPKLDRWYKRAGRSLVYLTGITRGVGYGYGFDIDGNWFDRCNGNPIFIDCLVEATPQEVEEALVREAKRRYKVGDTVRCLDGINNVVHGTDMAFANYKLFSNGDRVNDGEWFNTSGCLFDNGKWASIIDKPVDKFSELKEAHKNGAVIQYNEGAGWFDVFANRPSWRKDTEYRIKPEEKPKVGDVVKAWCRNEEHYVVGNLTDINTGTENKYGVHILGISDISNTIYYANAKPLTKQEAIELLFGKEVQGE